MAKRDPLRTSEGRPDNVLRGLSEGLSRLSSRGWIARVAGAGVLFVLIVSVMPLLFGPNPTPTPKAVSTNVPAVETPLDETPVASTPGTGVDLTLRSAKIEGITHRLDRLLDDINKLRATSDQFDRQLEKLQTSEKGRQLASDEQLLQRFRALAALDRPQQGDIERLREQAQIYSEAYQKSDAEITNVDKHVLEINVIGSQVTEAAAVLRKHLAALDLLTKKAKQRPAGTTTLKDTISILEDREAAEFVAATQAEGDRVREEELQRAKEEAARIQKSIVQTKEATARKRRELALLEAQTENRKTDAALEIARIKDAAVDAELALKVEFEREHPAIEQALVAFTTHATSQPSPDDIPGFVENSTQPIPVSLNALQSAGALDDTVESLQRFAKLVSRGERPTGPLPRWNGYNQSWPRARDACKPVQRFLIKYGELMVDKGKLSK